MAEEKASFKEALDAAILSFRCAPDTDIETFLHCKAITFYKSKLCSVYLLLNEEQLNNGKLQIDAYFTLSHKNIRSSEVDATNKTLGKITGGYRKKEILEFVLIGQLGKHIEELPDGSLCTADISGCTADISGKEILDKAFEIMQLASLLIPSRCALIECSDEPKVRKIYEDYKFTFLQRDNIHNQYYKVF